MEDLRSKFNDLKFQLGKKYSGDNYKVLKFCLFDYIPLGTLTAKDSIGHTLFNALDTIGGSGVVSPYDVDLLLEITTLTGPRDANALVNQYIEDNDIQVTNTNQLTLYRKQLYRAVTQAELGAINTLSANYGFNVAYTNLWDAVLKLEGDQLLANEPSKLKNFGKNLGKTAEDELLKLLTDVPDLGENPHPAVTPKFVPEIDQEKKALFVKTEQRPKEHTFGISGLLIMMAGYIGLLSILIFDHLENTFSKSLNFIFGNLLLGITLCFILVIFKLVRNYSLQILADTITKVVDCTGGTLYHNNEDINLVIKPGAIEEGKKIEISLENIWNKTKDPALEKFETIVSPVVRCGPPGTVFKKHCILSFPYNAVNEECWEFTLLVKDSFQDKWRRIKLGSDEKDIHFSLHNGQCVVNLIHFTEAGLLGCIVNDNTNRAAKTVMLGVFGKMHLNKYQLRVRTWNLGNKKMVRKEAKEFGEKLVEMPTPINVLYEHLVVRLQDVNNGWQIPAASTTKTFSADELWNNIPWRLFKFTRSDPPSDVLEATISSSQVTNTFPELEISCETRQENISSKSQEVIFWFFISALTVIVVGLIIAWTFDYFQANTVIFWFLISALTVIVVGLIIAWTFDYFQAFLASHSGIAFISVGLLVLLITIFEAWTSFQPLTPHQILAGIFLNMIAFCLGVRYFLGSVYPKSTVQIIGSIVVIFVFLAAVMWFGEDALKFMPFIIFLSNKAIELLERHT